MGPPAALRRSTRSVPSWLLLCGLLIIALQGAYIAQEMRAKRQHPPEQRQQGLAGMPAGVDGSSTVEDDPAAAKQRRQRGLDYLAAITERRTHDGLKQAILDGAAASGFQSCPGNPAFNIVMEELLKRGHKFVAADAVLPCWCVCACAECLTKVERRRRKAAAWLLLHGCSASPTTSSRGIETVPAAIVVTNASR